MLLSLPELSLASSETWAANICYFLVCALGEMRHGKQHQAGGRYFQNVTFPPLSLQNTSGDIWKHTGHLLNPHKILNQIISHKQPSWNVIPLPSLQVFTHRGIQGEKVAGCFNAARCEGGLGFHTAIRNLISRNLPVSNITLYNGKWYYLMQS